MPRYLLMMLLSLLLPQFALAENEKRPPNFIIIFADDLGYGDLSCYGHPTIRTPNLDRMAAQGIRFTQFYAAASVCTPSRAGLMTGRLPVRNGMCSDKRRVLFPNSGGGLPQSEITLASALKPLGYTTACVGKWHLGHLPEFLPTSHGFDSYFGIPYSNDMDRVADTPKGREVFWEPKSEYFNVPLLRNTEIVERPADQTTITLRYAEESLQFITENRERPFFLYLAHNLPHVPLFRSPAFADRSPRGLYGDVIEEIDHTVGLILDGLKCNGIDDRTFVFFTSDNGPWLTFDLHGGSAGLLKDGKGCTWEGGMREPAIGWWPGTIPAGTVTTELGSTLDLWTTCVSLAGGKLPTDRVMDGYDLTPLLTGAGPSPRKSMFYYRGPRLMAVRHGDWKAHFITQGAYDGKPAVAHATPQLYHLGHDPGEKYDVADKHPEVVAELLQIADDHRQTVTTVPSQLEIPLK